MRRRLGVSLAWLVWMSVVHAHSEALPLVGTYSISGVHEGDGWCLARLTDEPTIGGLALELQPACLALFDFPEDTLAWNYHANSRTITFHDALRRLVVRFEQTGDGAYIVPVPGANPRMAMQRESVLMDESW